ncbi:H-type small acid-soluble spore protein [Tepidibacillus sp. LV47]|uniref:H-type small acid-soluble spore protein n=1 Tax=Tepidibacillus sp. LV47 TaxID=3398228 RepID=UPI003AAFDA57
MKYSRAEEILNSKDTIEVLYHDQSVWIQNLNPQTETAVITNMDNETFEVPVRELVEGDQK